MTMIMTTPLAATHACHSSACKPPIDTAAAQQAEAMALTLMYARTGLASFVSLFLHHMRVTCWQHGCMKPAPLHALLWQHCPVYGYAYTHRCSDYSCMSAASRLSDLSRWSRS
jgi:hypothetical protein